MFGDKTSSVINKTCKQFVRENHFRSHVIFSNVAFNLLSARKKMTFNLRMRRLHFFETPSLVKLVANCS